MEKKLYSIYDKLLERYNIPGFDEDDRTCQIGLSREMKRDQSSYLFCNKDDLDLYCLGTFDDKTGIITDNQPRLVCHISSLTEE